MKLLEKYLKLEKINKGLKEGDKVCVYPLITCGSPDCCGNSISAYGLQKNPNLCSKYDFLGSRSHGGYSEYVLAPIKSLVKNSR
jgi:L-iditol 2-dehydrogenase